MAAGVALPDPANVFDTGAAPFQGGGGSSGMGGSIYGGSSSSGGGIDGSYGGGRLRQLAAAGKTPTPTCRCRAGLGMPASSPSGASPLDWGSLFGGGGARPIRLPAWRCRAG